MKLVLPDIPNTPDLQDLAEHVRRVLRDLAYIVNGRLEFDEHLDVEEFEVTFAAAGGAGTQTLSHTLGRVPVRAETVRADQAGIVYVVATSDVDVDLETDTIGTYRVRVS